jgi:hypothetical protein
MNDLDENISAKYSFSKAGLRDFFNWFFFAAIAFISVMLIYQLFVAGISVILGYETHVHIGKVDSLPHTIDHWSSNRVLLLYVFPPLFLLVVGLSMMAVLLFGSPKVNYWTWFRFWFMVFSILFASTLMSLSFYSWTQVTRSLFQGFAVLIRWFGLTYIWAVLSVAFSIILNFSLGFAASFVLIPIARGNFIVRRGKRYAREIILTSFACTIISVFLIAIILGYPGNAKLFLIMFSHSILWIPGLLNISNEAMRRRKGMKTQNPQPPSLYLQIGILVVLIVLIRVFLH